ncbi:hypothetical protein Ddye_024959 [Dipteronia dyeriana]|uniref:Uncharacterized protein n=1 Tax=Dipteronia dyeriana TaxID=168575 RepID=A0AAD9TVX2_9ROSI|nr:hypothetical protein Ddye_024959 [Dipteronia dyeriana]
MGNEHVDYIPGVSPTHLMDFPLLVNGSDPHILRSAYKLERRTIDALRAKFCFPIYTNGPAIPFFKLEDNFCLSPRKINEPNHMHWLNCQPNRSVLYISFGSFLPVSGAQMDEIAAGKPAAAANLKRLGGFLTHCGWNSVREGLFSDVPSLTFPLGSDQMTNSKLIEEDWKIGWRVRKLAEVENLVSRDTIWEHVVKFMDMESNEGKQMRRRVKEV